MSEAKRKTMVVIQPEEKEEQQLPIPPKPKPKTKPSPASSSSSDTAATIDAPPPPPTLSAEAAASAAPSAKGNGNESEGFETASERGVTDNEEGDDDDEEEQQQQQSSSNGDEESESKQRALEKANEVKLEGNKLFGEGKYEEALLLYEAALEQAPPAEDMPALVELRSICHSNRGVCFLKLGKYEDTVKECSKALALNPSYLKALVRRGEAHEKLEHFEEAISDMKKILELDPSNDQAKKSIRHLEPLAAEKREKMKEEMIGKLKEMGDNILGRFGMSIDNFKAVKDPNTGSYSISFQR